MILGRSVLALPGGWSFPPTRFGASWAMVNHWVSWKNRKGLTGPSTPATVRSEKLWLLAPLTFLQD